MIWISLIFLIVSLALSYADVQHVWLRHITFIISLSAFLVVIFQSVPKKYSLRRWFATHILSVTLVPFFITLIVITKHYDRAWDLSRSKHFTFTEETKKWLSSLPDNTEIIFFVHRTEKTYPIIDFLSKQMKNDAPLLRIVRKNIHIDFSLAHQYGVTSTEDFVVRADDRWVRMSGLEEKNIVKGIMELNARSHRAICFMTGHGEADILRMDGSGLSILNEKIINLGYKTRAVHLFNMDLEQLVDECAALLMMGSRQNFIGHEKDLINKIFDSRLPIFMAIDVEHGKSTQSLLSEWGIEIESSFIVRSTQGNQNLPLTDVLIDECRHRHICQDIEGVFYFHKAQALKIVGNKTNEVDHIINTPFQDMTFRLADAPDKAGPFTLALELTKGRSYHILFGTSYLFRNKYIEYGANMDLFLKCLQRLIRDHTITNVALRGIKDKRLDLSYENVDNLKLSLFYIFPGVQFFICLAIWLVHRRK
jgi:hypothetical protein